MVFRMGYYGSSKNEWTTICNNTDDFLTPTNEWKNPEEGTKTNSMVSFI